MMHEFRADDGARLRFRDEGEGVPLLALAGLTRDSRDFDYVAPHLRTCRLIRLDARGRGQSDWTGWESYTLEREARDVLALLDHLDLPRAAILGTSRGGLLGMVLAATARDRLTGLCLCDVGPELGPAGLARIGAYVGVSPDAKTLDEMAELLPATRPGFANVPATRWREECARHFVQRDGALGLPYDPALGVAVAKAMEGDAPDLWPLFDASAGLPLALIRGANSDLLLASTADAMQARRPDMVRTDVPDRGHVPFLDEPEAVSALMQWLGRLASGKGAEASGSAER
ncbi:MAG: alpha/beta hydrolase [Pseudomonadota bacterium]